MRLSPKLVVAMKLAAVSVVALATLGQVARFMHAPVAGIKMDETLERNATPGFRISGHVTKLYPGKRARLVAFVRNPNPFPIKVTRVRVTVGNAPGCSGRNIVIKRFKGRHRVGGHRSIKLKLRVRMRASAPNTCQGDRFPLVYHGRAVKA